MKKFVCTVCGYVYEGEAAPEKCPVCGVGADKFTEVKEGEREWAAEHNTAQQQVNSTLQNVQKLQTSMQSMTQFMKWQETKQDTEKHSKDYSNATLAKLQAEQG